MRAIVKRSLFYFCLTGISVDIILRVCQYYNISFIDTNSPLWIVVHVVALVGWLALVISLKIDLRR